MLSNVLRPVVGKNIGEHCSGARLLRGVFNTRPKETIGSRMGFGIGFKKVLPFGPLRTVPFKHILYKFALLLPISTTRRFSDLSHIAIGEFFRIQNSTITFLPTNLVKANDESYFLKDIVISCFPDNLLDVSRFY